MTIFNSMSVSVLIILLIAGAAIGLFASQTDLVNPHTSQAKAGQIEAETRHLDAMNQLEEQLAAAKTEAEIAKIRHDMGLEEARYQDELARIAADQAYYQESLRIKLDAQQMFLNVLLILSGTAGVAIILIGTRFVLVRINVLLILSGTAGVAIILIGTRFVLVRIQPPAPVASPKQPLRQVPSAARSHHSPNGYEQMRIQARQREILDRQIMLQRMNSACNPSRTTKEDYHNLPLAGD